MLRFRLEVRGPNGFSCKRGYCSDCHFYPRLFGFLRFVCRMFANVRFRGKIVCASPVKILLWLR